MTDKADKDAPKKGRKRRRWPYVLVPLLAIYSVHLFWPWITFYGEGDKCTLGTVSNARYRTYLAQAKDQISETWRDPGSVSNESAWAREVARQIDMMIKGEPSFYHRIAKMHAVVRALNGQYHYGGWYLGSMKAGDKTINRKRNAADPPVPIQDEPSYVVRYSYMYDRLGNRWIPFRPFSLGTSLTIRIWPTVDAYRRSLRYRPRPVWTTDLFARVHVSNTVNLKATPPLFERIRRPAPPVGGHCPRLPSEDWLDRFIAYQAEHYPNDARGVTKP